MVEVFKTDVTQQDHANILLEEIRKNFAGYQANFDLEDCDRILRVQAPTGHVQSPLLIDLLKKFGYRAEVLPDDENPASRLGSMFHYLNY